MIRVCCKFKLLSPNPGVPSIECQESENAVLNPVDRKACTDNQWVCVGKTIRSDGVGDSKLVLSEVKSEAKGGACEPSGYSIDGVESDTPHR